MIKAIICDMDGVLIEAKEWHYEALNRALDLFGLPISRYDHLVTYDGLPTKKKLEMLTAERGLPVGLHGFINDMKQNFTVELIHKYCKPVFHHQYALCKLREKGYRVAVCSNSIRATVQLMMEKSELLQYLDFFLSNQDVKKGKPDPEMYNKAIERLELKPTECLILEDNDNGLQAAYASGAHVMRVITASDVNYQNIFSHIAKYDSMGDASC